MSDFNLLFKKYNSVSNLTNDLNKSVITLKRRNLTGRAGVKDLHPKLQVSDEEVKKALSDIMTILHGLEQFYRHQDSKNDLYELKDNTLFKNQILKNDEFKNQILSALEKLNQEKRLSATDLSNIDRFISILDNEASILFRKLRTNRG
ncbi:hypothetical protein [Pedobacter nyackensis]|uniref:Uncharacterized protein n=1 Tax=Pedobacter nyackensis TaxID=475255 RepID=A0A1W2A027_9SPHI|nr:hypothetical protein [Pedobacter nyackensis]SMC54027.1 hypothetical protein SAMN04488101_101209 [Pedobacter nyackensis]